MSINNLYNFEAIFNKFIETLTISRTGKKGLKTDFKDYLNVLKLSFPAKKLGNYSRLFSAQVINLVLPLFKAKHKNMKSLQQFNHTLNSFRKYLIHTKHIYQTISDDSKNDQEIINSFIRFLDKKKFSASTIKNYQSDLNQLAGFLDEYNFSLNNLKEEQVLNSYVIYLNKKLILSPDSIKRKLSSLSSLLKWIGNSNFAEIKPKIDGKKPLTEPTINSKKASLLSPVFFTLIYPLIIILFSVILSVGIYQKLTSESGKTRAVPIQPPKHYRILNYQGMLTEKDGSPIVEQTRVRFRIWNQINSGQELYNSGFCNIIPDQNGIFYTVIGSTCGQEISSDIFSQNLHTFLGVTVGLDEEMSPRQPVASTGYSLNSQKLQGLSVSSPAAVSTIPYINKEGQLILGLPSPLIRSTSGTFTLEGNNLSLETVEGSAGSINLNPDDNGMVNINLSGFFPVSSPGLVNITGQNIISGSLISAVGSSLTAGYKLLDLTSGNPLSSKFS